MTHNVHHFRRATQPNVQPLQHHAEGISPFDMTTDATTSPHPGLALPICLAIIVLPPLLAIIIAAINSLTQRYGHALYRVLCLVFCVAAYAAQVAMVLGTTACIYYSFGAYTIHMDPSMPSALAPLYCAVLSLSFGLGFLAIMMVGLYLFEAVLSQTVKKTPTQLTIVETAVSCTGAIVTCKLPL